MASVVGVERVQRELEAIFGPRRVSLREVDLETYARDMWPRALLGYREGHKAPARPHAVVWPEQVDEGVRVVKLARAQRIPIVPYGGGSGVGGGAVPLEGGLTSDTKRTQQLREVQPAALTGTVEAGESGERVERGLGCRGHAVGHCRWSV